MYLIGIGHDKQLIIGYQYRLKDKNILCSPTIKSVEIHQNAVFPSCTFPWDILYLSFSIYFCLESDRSLNWLTAYRLD